jgi:hypothetical protein
MVYSGYIIQNSTHSNYSSATQRDLVMDTAGNLTQIGTWARGSFVKESRRIELFLRLTRKNLNALLGFPISASFDPCFHKFSNSFTRLEKEYHIGIVDHSLWANRILSWGNTLTKSAKLI